MSISGVGGSSGIQGSSSPQDPKLRELAKRYADIVEDIYNGNYLPSDKFNALVKDTENYIKDHLGMDPGLKKDLTTLMRVVPWLSDDVQYDRADWSSDYSIIEECIDHLNKA